MLLELLLALWVGSQMAGIYVIFRIGKELVDVVRQQPPGA